MYLHVAVLLNCDFGLQIARPVDKFRNEIVIDVAASPQGGHVLAVCANGLAYSWGRSANGKLGHGDTIPRKEPCVIEAISNRRAVRVAVGWEHSLVLTDDGVVFGFGSSARGQLRQSSTAPCLAPVPLIDLGASRAVKDLAADGMQSVFLLEGGEITVVGSWENLCQEHEEQTRWNFMMGLASKNVTEVGIHNGDFMARTAQVRVKSGDWRAI